MKITQEAREFAASQELTVLNAVDTGLQQKAEEFRASGGELYGKESAGVKQASSPPQRYQPYEGMNGAT